MTATWEWYESRGHTACHREEQVGCCDQRLSREHEFKGPVGFLLKSLADHGLTVSKQWDIFQSGRRVCQLVKAPIQRLKPLCFQIGASTRLLALEARRADFQGAAGCDSLTWKASRDFTKSERQLLRRVQMGG
eukprot:5772537-Alexandrium_andersonii.AAC.1